MKILITGGAGYIGSTIASALEDSGHVPVLLDSLVNGRIEFTRNRIFYQGDIADAKLLARIFSENIDITCAIHCAALVNVADSVNSPYNYYKENVAKSIELFKNLHGVGCINIVFSSSASVYDDVPNFMVTESSPLNPRSPYASTKYMVEVVLRDFCQAHGMRSIALRYFNPIGADMKMRSGIYARNPSHVLGKLVSVALGREQVFKITGVDWETRDGSGVRDYIHVWDLAIAHVKAVENIHKIFQMVDNSFAVLNLGTGKGVTVFELVEAFERVYGKVVKKEIALARPGDVAGAYANAETALKLIGWRAEKSIDEGIADALKWDLLRETIIKP
ncbi:UDP-glucose 4-epimerase GalE [Desulfosporosinus sp. Sb-LF]|uniref:UDP-glucose 4-epimerase GalE n=1 Tax=Desulfosporosinus sp. Sb-LF TaxID=2560027 RepID=UPI00107F3A09|nr:UDP-glucose 4-epimerase GalE [Desulfosporosinus sp. Sb-LF]TGE33800.1 UDP-glucose 4-epimerase GalE [Desulfosporosinus sp. Sb-LF]